MESIENPYSILLPYLPMDSFRLLRPRIMPEAGDGRDPARGELPRPDPGAAAPLLIEPEP